jgi:transcriptional regulator with XRE-family HTH domain
MPQRRRLSRRSVAFRRFARQLASHLRRLRVARAWTQRDLAERVGTGVASIRRLERASGNPSLAVLLRIAQVFRIPLADLLRAPPRDH